MMTIEHQECPHCGATLRIETDDPQYMKDRKEKWEREHKDCPIQKEQRQC